MRIILALLAASLAFAADPPVDAKSAFARLKSLVGEWQADTSMGKVYVTYELIAGGTVLVEKETFDHMAPMMTMFHLDNDKLMLTHYCDAGNQPRMRAGAYDMKTGEIRFDFVDITNAATNKVGHMHNAKLRLENTSLLVADWDFWEGGAKKSTESFRYTRVR